MSIRGRYTNLLVVALVLMIGMNAYLILRVPEKGPHHGPPPFHQAILRVDWSQDQEVALEALISEHRRQADPLVHEIKRLKQEVLVSAGVNSVRTQKRLDLITNKEKELGRLTVQLLTQVKELASEEQRDKLHDLLLKRPNKR